jgi:hypothetical protein
MRIASGILVGILLLIGGSAAHAQDSHKPIVYNHLTEAGAGMDHLVHATYDDAFTIVDFSDRDSTYVPPHVLYGPQPTVPPAEAGAQLAGTVVVFFIIKPDGLVTQPVVVSSSDPRLNPGILATLNGWIFTSARVNGRPVAVTAGQEFTLP